MARAVGILQK